MQLTINHHQNKSDINNYTKIIINEQDIIEIYKNNRNEYINKLIVIKIYFNQ